MIISTEFMKLKKRTKHEFYDYTANKKTWSAYP